MQTNYTISTVNQFPPLNRNPEIEASSSKYQVFLTCQGFYNTCAVRLKSLIAAIFKVASNALHLLLATLTFNCLHAHAWDKQSTVALHTNLLCVLYDAGETSMLMPVLKKWEKEGKDFRVLVMATAEKQVSPDDFPGKRLVLNDLGSSETIAPQAPRTTLLSSDTLEKIRAIQPHVVLTGMASQTQEQILGALSNCVTVAIADNFNYDPLHESFATVKKVQRTAQHILCPSQNVIDTFIQTDNDSLSSATHTYHVVGKPTISAWEKEIAAVEKSTVLETMELDPHGGPIVTFIGGYGDGYDVVNPLFQQCMEKLRTAGYQVILQPHPRMAPQKIKTTEALAISDYVVGYNSSVILDACLIGKNALFLIPDSAPFNHFAIKQGLIAKVDDAEGLLSYFQRSSNPADVRNALKMPQNSTETIASLVEQWISETVRP